MIFCSSFFCFITIAMTSQKNEAGSKSDKVNTAQKFSLPLADFPISISHSDLFVEQLAYPSLKELCSQVRPVLLTSYEKGCFFVH